MDIIGAASAAVAGLAEGVARRDGASATAFVGRQIAGPARAATFAAANQAISTSIAILVVGAIGVGGAASTALACGHITRTGVNAVGVGGAGRLRVDTLAKCTADLVCAHAILIAIAAASLLAGEVEANVTSTETFVRFAVWRRGALEGCARAIDASTVGAAVAARGAWLRNTLATHAADRTALATLIVRSATCGRRVVRTRRGESRKSSEQRKRAY